ncbi:MAG: glycosyltransferase family 2 protein [Planctomycetota bacterium]|nr:glycosyltransferase family 2 protein [Planctomycetota bacterium]
MILAWLFWIALALIFYAYLGYPFLCLLIGKPSDASLSSKMEDSDLPTVSVLIPAHNEASVIRAKIENFQRLDYPQDKLELIIADDGSGDGTSARVEPFIDEHIKLIRSEERTGKAATMNRLVEASEHDLMLFSDANVILQENALRELVSSAMQPNAGAVTGEVRLIDSCKEFRHGELLYYWMERRIQVAESRLGSVMGVDGGMYLLHRELYQILPEDMILDDFAVSMNVLRVRKRVLYSSAAKATESGTPTGKQEFSRRVRIAAGAVQLLFRAGYPRLSQPVLMGQYISHKLLRWCSPLLFLTLFASSLSLISGPFYLAAAAIQLSFLLLLLLTFASRTVRESQPGSVVYYFGMSQIGIIFGLCKGLFNMQPPQWEKASRPDSEGTPEA